MSNSREKKRANIGVLFWVAFILLVAVIFLANRTNIQRVLESTGLVSVLQDEFGFGAEETPKVERSEDSGGSGAQGEGEPEEGSDDRPAPGSSDGESPSTTRDEPTEGSGSGTGDASPSGSSGDTSEEQTVVVTPEEEQEEDRERSDQGDTASGSEATGSQDGGETSGSASEASDGEESGSAVVGGRPERERDASIYYIRVTDDGTIHPERVKRSVEYVDSPMTQTLKSLLRGPTPEELSLGLLNLIPDGTELISARVENGVAYLNFSEEFRFNSMGVEGFIAQLQQIVFSSTEFSTVRRVQILIEGETVEYLGEGVYVGEPLGRDSFS